MSDYDEQLEEALSATPDIRGGEARFTIPDPDVRQEGNATVYENFRTTVDRLNREQGLVLRFLQNELGTSAHIDERERARLTGAFTADRISNAVEAFADAYVLCSECGLPDTRLETEQGAETIRCTACGAVSPAG
jgi:translation initiation factor 2 subunit 2